MFIIKQNDTAPSIKAILSGFSDLTGVSVVFNMKPTDDDTVKISRGTGNIVDETKKLVEYEWQAADTDTSGTFYGEFEVTYSDGSIETYPNNTCLQIKIIDDIA